jgi:hypothetical protein
MSFLRPRTIRARLTLPLLALVFASAMGCQPKREPEIASSAGDASYAVAYPTELSAMASGIEEHRREITKLTGGFAAYPDQLKDAPKAQVLQIIERADEAGRGSAYVERAKQMDQVTSFFDAEKEEINKKVGGSAQYVAKQKGCDVDVYGTVAKSLKDSVDKQVEKRQRDRNEAQLIIERYRVSLGKPNAAALEKQADEISRASYYANVELVERKNRLTQMAGEADRVKKTADQFIERERAFQAEPGRTDPEKKASDERITAMNQSKAALDTAAAQAKSQLADIDNKIKASQKEYADALAALKARFKK